MLSTLISLHKLLGTGDFVKVLLILVVVILHNVLGYLTGFGAVSYTHLSA